MWKILNPNDRVKNLPGQDGSMQTNKPKVSLSTSASHHTLKTSKDRKTSAKKTGRKEERKKKGKRKAVCYICSASKQLNLNMLLLLLKVP